MKAVSMTSKEIAEVTGKRHDNVLQDMKRMLKQLYPEVRWDSLKFRNEEIQGVTVEVDHRGFISSITLDKHHTFTLVSGYYARMRMATIKYIDKLEAAQNIAPPALPSPGKEPSLVLQAFESMTPAQQVEVVTRIFQANIDALNTEPEIALPAQSVPRRRPPMYAR